ncbi:putative rmlC-like jelly roll protein [Medicago truncatula]|uniref:Cupin protein n=1 Tax=Medicago truncatula TaxID=3880 RepID=A0A072TXC2_MEDTR|nr:cupin protein [Medicago truncatula]RHN45164.1 putative rmlC-like jelly roll protein [Medicago truncatula]
MLRQGNIGAAKLALQKNGFVVPMYSDSSKVAYVLQGLDLVYLSNYSDVIYPATFVLHFEEDQFSDSNLVGSKNRETLTLFNQWNTILQITN